LLNTIEMAVRAYDPCHACATHSLPGQMPLQVTLRGPQGEVRQRLSQLADEEPAKDNLGVSVGRPNGRG
jgi:F420-non-reducing hydrogenase large subunit